MSPLLISLGAGALAGLIYALLKVRSPAPPAVALIGLLGMVIGSALGGKLLHQDTAALTPAGVTLPVVADSRPHDAFLTSGQVG